MVRQQRIATWFFCLACLVILICMSQRMVGIPALEQSIGLTTISQTSPEAEASQTSCELSAKSLLTTPLVLFEQVYFALGLLLLTLLVMAPYMLRLPPPRAISPSQLRVHLRFCIFRE
ncbi:copper resistance protein [Yersinia ruckeri]|uniref:Copper binding protein ScsA n=1 Tax=Yersinia ruckeri TaxID=29486 RepID=A0A085U502_YERRU|nr:hypothetical protein [Yersinia ruckeri]AJI95087.1 putative metal resistance protein [Yersinia ruckeri]AKA37818.1 copper resistance protein [Yersinia ruckeri]ARZ00353.1 metal resistance protein [Yersinia ruckeri]AUQ42459.1 copper resistance protein [Yersinia ruckeri]EEQ00387.1 Membrane protein, suppressor for copper-sensitivity A [Yersinia ruckeri ATCC 29473]